MSTDEKPVRKRRGGALSALLFVLLLGYAVWNYLHGFQESATYTCKEAATWHLPPRWLATLGGWHIIDQLEVYGGGWIEHGQLTITSNILNEPLVAAARTDGSSARTTPISFARVGEWYEPEFHLNFSPSAEPTASHSEMSTRYARTATTSPIAAPASASARWITPSATRVCTIAPSGTLPSGCVPVVPDTQT